MREACIEHMIEREPVAKMRHCRPIWGLLSSLMLGLFCVVAVPTTVFADPTNPTFAIVNPSYNGVFEGPVGTYVTVKATSGWTPSAAITLSVEPESTPCDPSTATLVQPINAITASADGSFQGTFQWPSSVNQPGAYHICANESGAGTQKGTSQNIFSILTNSSSPGSVAPTVSVSAATAHVGDKITVTGDNWLPSQQITFILQYPGKSFAQDSGTPLSPTATSDPNGHFSQDVTIPNSRVNALVITAVAGTPYPNDPKHYPYPLMEQSQQFVVSAAPTPTTVPSPTATAVPTSATSGTGNSSGNTNALLIALLALIAVVLLVAGIIVAVLVLRGRNQQQRPPESGGTWGGTPPGGVAGWNDPYAPASPWEETQMGPPSGWGGWQQPPGQPWSGRESRPYTGAYPPNGGAFDDPYEDDPYRTRMGEPPMSRPAPGGPQISRPAPGGPPISRPTGNMPPRSPSGPASYWDEGDTNQDTIDWSQNPPRR
jgi:hypothetical protein